MERKKKVSHRGGGQRPKKPPKSNRAGFAVFGLNPQLSRAIEKLEWTTPTPVQLAAIPLALKGYDLIALAQTGTGKTGAYLLPVLEAITQLPRATPLRPYCLILAPTRELVQQIDVQAKALLKGQRCRSMTIFGGVSERPQIRQLRDGVELVAATPGRLLDLMSQGQVKFEEIRHIVLDESDRMFDMGFINDLKRILSKMPKRKQTMLFSATMPAEIQRLTQEYLYKPREVRLGVSLPPVELSHEVWELEPAQKNAALYELLREADDSVLVFTRTKHRADSLARRLARSGEEVAVLHGNRSQNQRDQALARFRQGEARILVATDVASRGLDVTGIGLVINYDTPRDPDDYIHRVGRTARAKRQGCAVSLMLEDEIKYIRKIEKLLKRPITRRQSVPQESDSARSAGHGVIKQKLPGTEQPRKPRKQRSPQAKSKRAAGSRNRRQTGASTKKRGRSG